MLKDLFKEIDRHPHISIEDVMRRMADTILSEYDPRDHETDEGGSGSVDYMPYYGEIEDQKNDPLCVAQTCEAVERPTLIPGDFTLMYSRNTTECHIYPALH
jgi:hypothetical protein